MGDGRMLEIARELIADQRKYPDPSPDPDPSPSPSPSPNQVRPDDPLQAKAILESGGKILKPISPAFTEPARLTTLALHSDWVSSLAYEESTP